MIHIELTEQQREILQPLFNEIKTSNAIGERCSIAAQIWPDGLVAKTMTGEKHDALCHALGGNNKACSSSSKRIVDA